MGMLMVHNLSLGYQSRLGWLTGAILPWCVYAVTLRGIGRHGRGTPAYRALPRLLVVGFAAAVLNSLLLTAIDLNDDGSLAAGLPPKIGRAHVCTPVTNAHLVCRLLLEKKKQTTD